MKDSEHIRLNEQKWDSWAPVADSKEWKYEYLRNAQLSVLNIAGLKENVHFLDLGCGTGWAVGQAARMLNNKGAFYGVDLSAKMIEKAQENYNNSNLFHFIKANAVSIPLEDNFFDVIICTHSFHHYLHPDKVMKEIYRLLKTGGRVFILDPPADLWIVKIIDVFFRLFEPEHVKLYSSKEFEKLMTEAGLKYTDCNLVEKRFKVQIGEK